MGVTRSEEHEAEADGGSWAVLGPSPIRLPAHTGRKDLCRDGFEASKR